MKKFKKYKESILSWKFFDVAFLVILFLVGFFLRSYLMDKNLFFGPEQGRDMLVVKDIVISHKLVLIGPKTAIEGIFHGPLYYYLAAVPFIIGKGNPLVISIFFIFINSLSVFFIYFLGKELFNRKIGLLSSLFFTFSFGSIAMARWLSHPPLILPISCIFFLFLIKFIKGENKYLIPSVIFYGLASQAEFSDFIIFTFIIFFTVIIFRKRFLQQKILNLIVSLFLAVILPIGNFILFDLRHNFLIIRSILESQQHRPEFIGYLGQTLVGSSRQFANVYSDNILPFNSIFVSLLFFISLASLLKLREKYKNSVYIMLIWIFSPFVAFILLKYNPLYHYFASSIIALIILAAVLIDNILSFKKGLGLFILAFLLLANFTAWYIFLPTNQNVFFQSTQPGLKYSDEAATIKEIYKQAQGRPFFFQAYTIPYWLQQGWEYLFWYYGAGYGYVPVHMDKGLLFVIIQDDPSNTLYQTNWLRDTVSHWGIKDDEFKYGDLRVEKLILK